ncbi:S-methyl-5-thioribose kinase [Guptibacillus hwajinpoensis]|uniref:S-methyl-5-thioribose kinase n=1 Tax=Guptibacillus hwajinpoensis TaxID=208199 RepID=UPI00273ECF25|nr:S-methyl-5-thioribose kinase [Pseudalkalibacillus hwajinpoensis]WLR58625.1 S-methyl-5-thioribose kinase [Pseudalkalibacillus hwajinpoensis]
MGIQITSGYTPFTTETVVQFLEHHELLDRTAPVLVKEIGDGNLNYVFHVQHKKTGQSWIVKQALPYAKVVGESWPLTLDRSRIESEALKQAHSLVPDFSPIVYLHDSEKAATVMEDLSTYTILRKGLIEGRIYPELARNVGTYLAHTLFFTSDYGLGSANKKELAKRFSNPDLCGITESLVFSDPFYNAESNAFTEELRADVESLWEDDDFLTEVASLKHSFLTKGEALIHGDLHTGSLFVTESSTKIIDPEFAFYGTAGFDVGAFIANIALSILSQEAHRSEEEKEGYLAYLFGVTTEVWNVFESTFRSLWADHLSEDNRYSRGYLDALLQSIFVDSIGFSGCKIIRRTIGLAHVEEIETITDPKVKLAVEKKALSLGKELILNRKNITSIEQYIKAIKEVI